MAGEFLLTFAAEGILTKVSSLAAQELSLAWGFKSELKKLGKSLSVIQDYLRGVADRKPGEQSKGVEDWVKELKDIAHYADDVLDEFNYEILRRKAELQNHMKRKVINFLSASNPLLFRFKMAHKVKKINDSLIKLKNEAGFINLVAKRRDSRSGGERSNRDQTDSYFEKDEEVIGREDVVTDIVKTLVSSENQQNLSIMAIVGMPGLGKTTLAKSVYHNPEVRTHFNKKIWVCVSNTFEVVTILNQMVDSLKPEKSGLQSQDALLTVLREELTGKRYVLVLDDVWNEDKKKWESLISCLSKLSSNEGSSSIIITTRSRNVASIAETLPRHELKILSDDKCWSILKQRVQNQNEDGFIDVDREQIGRAIAKKCGGIPLVAKVLGGIMRSKISKDEWMSIHESEIWKLPEKVDIIMPVLKLSFDNLNSPSLKQCFAYCSLLRKDFEIERDDLIQLWMAQGLLQPSTDEIHYEMEDIGNQYFNVLLGNSLLQEVIDDVTITKYTMHDLVHDLAEEVSRCDSMTRDSNVTREIRHVAHLPISTLSCMSETVGRLRSLFSNDHVPPEIFSEFRALRVFSLREATTDELPDSFGKLKHLRYLDISNTEIKALPKSIGKLYNLQTLRLQNRFLKEIPREIQNLTNLRHLYFNKDVKVPAGIFRGLKNLRTLSNFNVGKEMGLGIEELGGLNQLQGKLAIRNMENVRDEEEANKAKLEDKKNLLGLSFVWTENRNGADGLESNTSDNVKDESVLERLQPHTKLESLEIENFLGSKFPSWMMPLYNLKNLILSGCLNCEELPVLGHLPSLKHVEVYKMDNLERLGSEFYGHNHAHEAARGKSTTTILFPALKTLRIKSCVKLTEWMEAPTPMTSEVTVFPRLEELCLAGCPVLRNAPSHFPSLRELWIIECRGLSSIGVPTSLQVLKINYCGSLTSIPISKGLPSLRKLRIWNCGGLASLPSGIENCTSLQILEIYSCGSLTSIPISKGLPSLRELKIHDCDGLASLPSGIENCDSLQVLEIHFCGSLTSIPISKGLPSLHKLRIVGCDRLSGLPDLHYCPSLQYLSVGYCEKLKSLPTGLRCLDRLEKLELGPFWEELHTFPDFQVPSQQLASLELNGWPKLKSLPRPIIHFTSVEEMTILHFNGVEALPEWLGNLTSVRKLHVLDCENVKYLPSLKAMRGLTKLETLRIARCPLLEERCAKDSGEEWPKISHVPNIRHDILFWG